MNFFGHAVAASWRRTTPRFVLGAMLPDFASMLGVRVEAVDPGEVADGVAWHHRTDAVFHRLRVFRRWSGQLTRTLASAGVGRGPSLAAGHVGVELLLDGVLVDREADLASVYTAALEATGETAGRIRWRGATPPIDHLATRLASRGLPVGYRDPKIVADRVTRVLARRPRLAIAGEHAAALTAALAAFRPTVAAGAAALLDEMRADLT